MERPHDDVVRYIKQYNQSLSVEYNPDWVHTGDTGTRFTICQKVLFMEEVGDGTFVVNEKSIPVLWIPQASEIDGRWIRVLEDQRIDRFVKRSKYADHQDHTRAAEKFVEERSDEDWWAFKNEIKDVNMSNMSSEDTYGNITKSLQDELGRELR